MIREPDAKIHDDYLWRWYLIPRNRWFNVYLHKFNEPDPGRDYHDHPWWNISIVLKGWYLEKRRGEPGLHGVRLFRFRRATDAHRIDVISHVGCVTLFITGPNRRTWGFWTLDGWQDWRTYLGVTE